MNKMVVRSYFGWYERFSSLSDITVGQTDGILFMPQTMKTITGKRLDVSLISFFVICLTTQAS